MFRSLLVPLDRSSFAEQALPFALCIARRAKASLDLVKVHALYAFQDPHAGWGTFDPDQDAEWKQQEQLYLDATAKRVTAASAVPVATAVLSGSVALPEIVATSIRERARSRKADLIVMATHARSPLNRALVGSVADKLIQTCRLPMLMIKPRETPLDLTCEPTMRRLLIPLDGSAVAEQILEPAVILGRLLTASFTLLHVVPRAHPPDVEHPGHARSSLDLAGPEHQADEATAYLEGIAGRMRAESLAVQTRVVFGRQIAERILQQAREESSDLIALATHGHSGVKRLLLGSVADQLIRTSTSPVLVYRPPGKET